MGLLDSPIGGAFEAPHDTDHHLGPMQRITGKMRCFDDDEEVDYLIVGVGSAGGVLCQRLARAGFKVVGIEAGKFWDTERDWVSDEVGSHGLYWEDPRVIGGTDPLALPMCQMRSSTARKSVIAAWPRASNSARATASRACIISTRPGSRASSARRR